MANAFLEECGNDVRELMTREIDIPDGIYMYRANNETAPLFLNLKTKSPGNDPDPCEAHGFGYGLIPLSIPVDKRSR